MILAGKRVSHWGQRLIELAVTTIGLDDHPTYLDPRPEFTGTEKADKTLLQN